MTERDPWKELEKLAREIDPTLPPDISGYELRITMSRDWCGVEIYKDGCSSGYRGFREAPKS